MSALISLTTLFFFVFGGSGYQWFSFSHLYRYFLHPPPPDIDECLVSSGECINAECTNNPGSFVCECLNGYFQTNKSNLQSPCGKNDLFITSGLVVLHVRDDQSFLVTLYVAY